jgi:hypothetical protein
MTHEQAMTSSHAFEDVLEKFKRELKKKDKENFKFVTFDELKSSIVELQAKQQSERRLRALTRLEPFLEAIKHLGTVVEVFCNSNEYVAFIWVCIFTTLTSWC